jgi:predicted solute-binding protein
LRSSKRFGLETLDQIIATRTEYDEDFRRDYFEWHIHYHLGEDEKRAIEKFCSLLSKHGLAPVFDPKFVK